LSSEKCKGMAPFMSSKRRLKDNIKIDLNGFEGVDLIHLAYYMFQRWGIVNTVIDLQVP
jgi:hypothetical protein